MATQEITTRLDTLSPKAKGWLHRTAQQLNDPDADGYIDNKECRKECADAGLIVMSGRYLEIPGNINTLLYSGQYLAAFALL